MSNEQFDNRIRQKLESVKPSLDPNAWKRFRVHLPQPWYLKLLHQYSAWIYGGLITAGLVGSLVVLYRNNQQIKSLHDEIATLKQQVVQKPQAEPSAQGESQPRTEAPVRSTDAEPLGKASPQPDPAAEPTSDQLPDSPTAASPAASPVEAESTTPSKRGPEGSAPRVSRAPSNSPSTPSATTSPRPSAQASSLPVVKEAPVIEVRRAVETKPNTTNTINNSNEKAEGASPLAGTSSRRPTTVKGQKNNRPKQNQTSNLATRSERVRSPKTNTIPSKTPYESSELAPRSTKAEPPRQLEPQSVDTSTQPASLPPVEQAAPAPSKDTLSTVVVPKDTISQQAEALKPQTPEASPEVKIKRQAFKLPSVRLRVGVESWWASPNPAFGPTVDLFLGSQLSIGTGLLVSRPMTVEHREPRDFNKATGKDFKEFYRNKIPPNDRIEKIQVQTSVIKLPIQLKFYLPVKATGWSVLASAGTLLDLSVQERVRFESYFQGVEQYNAFDRKVSPQGFHSMNFGVGAEYRWKRVVAQVAPYVDFCFRTCEYRPSSTQLGFRTSLLLSVGKQK